MSALASALAAALAPLLASGASDTIPAATWMRYADPAAAGWSEAGLAAAHAAWRASDSAAFLVVERGVVVAAWGDVDRRFMCHSVRKSFLSGLYGVHVSAGRIEREQTLAELGIDDEPALTDEEKTARVVDLLAARSGVYKLAAYEPPQNPKPPRGSHPPGTNWCYNNWDFNSLVTIFEQRTDTRVFEEFERRFAAPLGMQDYRPRDGYYHYERDKSIHPAYPFRMSARDMARYGLLFLYEGAWGEQRLLPAEWVAESTRSISSTGRPDRGYGYMWWTAERLDFAEGRMFSALGVGGQSIDVLPAQGLVCVNRTDTYLGRDVSGDVREGIIARVLEARGERPTDAAPKLVPLEACSVPAASELGREARARLGADLLGAWTLGRVEIVVRVVDGELCAVGETIGTFALTPLAEGIARIEDMRSHVRLRKGQVLLERASLRRAEGLASAGRLDDAFGLCEELLEAFPMSAPAHAALARLVESQGDFELAASLAETALELDPSWQEASELRERVR